MSHVDSAHDSLLEAPGVVEGPRRMPAYADFHSLRKCTATLLALGGVHPKIAQQFLRHSTIELTMGVYTDARLMPLADAVKALPIL